MRRKILTPSILFLTVFLINGCSFLDEQPYRHVDYFDLGAPQSQALDGVTVRFMKFRGIDAVKYKMVYHESDSRVQIDDYNKWIQPPGFMLNRYLQTAFCPEHASGSGKIYEINGTLFEFKIDLERRIAVIGATYVISLTGNSSLPPLLERSVVCSAPFKEQTGYAFSQAMSKAAEKLAVAIRKDIRKLSEKPRK